MPIQKWREHRRGITKVRKLASTVTVEKWYPGGGFMACVGVGRSGWRGGASMTKQSITCEKGRNPRLAVANALTKLGQSMKWRGEHGRGAFAGYSKSNRRRRRARRAMKRRY